MQRWMDPKQTPGLSGVQRRRIRRKAQRYAESLENKLAVLMTLQRKWDRVLRRLPPLQGAILQMRYGEGLPWRKIAERTGYSEKHLFKLRRAAIERLSREEID